MLGKEITRQRRDPFSVNLIVFGSGAFALTPVAAWEAWSFPFARVSTAAWLSVLYMALFPSLVCYLIFYYAP